MAFEFGDRQCVRCGAKGPFASRRKQRCVACDTRVEAAKRVYLRLYHRARSRAITRLITKHKFDFDRLMDVELERVRREEAARFELLAEQGERLPDRYKIGSQRRAVNRDAAFPSAEAEE